ARLPLQGDRGAPAPVVAHRRVARLGRAAQAPALEPQRADALGRPAPPDLELAHRVPKRLRLGEVLELLERVVLDLADALARDAQRASDLLERPRRAAVEAEAELDHLTLARRQRAERVLDVLTA